MRRRLPGGWRPNRGERPSRLELGRRLSGELPADPADRRLAAYREAVEAAARRLPPPDLVALRAAAERVRDAPPRSPPRRPAPRTWWPAALAALAAAVLLVVGPPGPPANRLKGGPAITFYTWRAGVVARGVAGEALAEGDRLRFRLHAPGHETVVLLSVDGRGALTVYYPESGDRPVRLPPDGLLPGSVELDDAPGPEVFVAVFGPSSVAEARELVERAWERGGHGAVEALARTDPAVATFRIRKADP